MFRDNYESIYKEIENNDKLIVVFGGLAGKLPIPVFEFFRTLDQFNIDKVFVRDLHQMWYQNGLLGYTENYTDTSKLLKNIISIKNYKQVTFLGNSSGGYASLLFGNLLKIDKIIAFSPQSFINSKLRWKNNDTRWSEEINKIGLLKHKCVYDIKKIVKNSNNRTSNIIYYSKSHILDSKHAERLGNLKNVILCPVNEGGHSLIRDIKSSGKLMEILKYYIG